jgi:Ni/Co efflux regulator RcnB
MKALKLVLIACSLSAAALAHAQTAPADESAQQVAQASAARVAQPEAQRPAPAPAKKANECVGPVSYCVMYFGS